MGQMSVTQSNYGKTADGKEVSIAISIYDDSVRLQLTLRELDSLKSDRRLTRVLEAFADSEWTPYSSDFTGGGAPNAPSRCWAATSTSCLRTTAGSWSATGGCCSSRARFSRP